MLYLAIFFAGFLFPPLWLINLYMLYREFVSRNKKDEPASIANPCPRCANNHVNLYPKTSGTRLWYYFTCGSCGARGWYPFNTIEERIMATHP